MTRAGWRLSGYRIEELIGAGSSGEVWRARVVSTGVAVALKKVWLSDPEQRRAALSEAALLQALDHPHLMRLHEVRHLDDDAIVLALDLAAGGSLAGLLARRGRLTVGETVTALAPIAAALAYAHNARIVHGDVSAANVLFTEIGLPLLADLGVSRVLGEAAPVRTTPSYIDPRVAGGAQPTTASDVFMLGGLALHALTGAPPWPGSVSAEVLDDAATGLQPDFAGQLARALIPDEVAGIVARALSVDPAARRTAADFALDLRAAAEPVAVELSAGRAARRVRAAVPSMSVSAGTPSDSRDSWPLRSVPPNSQPVLMESARVPPFAGEPPVTYGVRPPAPFLPGRHSARAARPRRKVMVAAAVCGALLAALAAVMWRPGAADRPDRAVPAGGAPVSSRSAKASASSKAGSAGADASKPARATTPLAALTALDERRASAFARRDPRMLAAVYDSDVLLARDRALLTSAVPVGCGLHGVRTSFTDLRVLSRTTGRVRLRVTAAVRPSTLVCGSTDAGHAPGTRPAVLDVDLIRVSDTYRIAAQRLVAPATSS